MITGDGRLHCRFEFNGESYEYHGEGGYPEYKQVHAQTGLTMLQVVFGVQNGHPDGLLAMTWLAKRVAGEDPDWEDLKQQMTDPQALWASIEHAPPPAAADEAETDAADKPKPRKPRRAAAAPATPEPDAPEPDPAT